MRTAVALRNVVGETQHGFVEAVVPLHRDIDDDAVALAVKRDRLIEQGRLRPVEIKGEGLEAAFVMECLGRRVGFAGIGQDDPHTRVEEG